MERVATRARDLPWPELTLLACGLLVILVLMVRTASTECHHWKQRMTEIGGAFLAAAGEEEFPQPETGIPEERSALRNAARQALDDRPLGCL